MNTYKRHRFLSEIISYAVWLYYYLWRAIDQDGEVVDVYVQEKRDSAAAKRFFNYLVIDYGGEPGKVVTNKLGSYRVAHRAVVPESIHVTDQYANNRAEQSHEATRVRERGMRRFKSVTQAQGFVTAYTAIQNLFTWAGTWFGLSTIGASG